MRTGSSNRPPFVGLVCRLAVRRGFEAALAACGVVTSMAFMFAVVAFVQATPEVPALSRSSEFAGERAFAELKCLVSVCTKPTSKVHGGYTRLNER
jgi:hypothetical protein